MASKNIPVDTLSNIGIFHRFEEVYSFFPKLTLVICFLAVNSFAFPIHVMYRYDLILVVFLVYGFAGALGGMISGCFAYIANRCDILDAPAAPLPRGRPILSAEGPTNTGQPLELHARGHHLSQEQEHADAGQGDDPAQEDASARPALLHARPAPPPAEQPIQQGQQGAQMPLNERDHSVHKMTRISILQSFVTFGYAAGYFLGGFVMQYWGFLESFAVLAGINLFSLLFVLILIPDIHPAGPNRSPDLGQAAVHPNYGVVNPNDGAVNSLYRAVPSSVGPGPSNVGAGRSVGTASRRPTSLGESTPSNSATNISPILQPTLAPTLPPPAVLLPLAGPRPAPRRSLECLLLPVELFVDCMHTTFVKRKLIPYGREKVIIALVILWTYLVSERIRTSLDYQYFLLTQSSFSNQRFGVFTLLTQMRERGNDWQGLGGQILPVTGLVWRCPRGGGGGWVA